MALIIRHLPFFEALGDQEWTLKSAGSADLPAFFVLRLFDFWIERDDAFKSLGVVDSIRILLRDLPASEAPSVACLNTALEQMEHAPRRSPFLVAPALLAYGIYLIHCSRYALAVDVLQTLADALEPYSMMQRKPRKDPAYDRHLIRMVSHSLAQAKSCAHHVQPGHDALTLHTNQTPV